MPQDNSTNNDEIDLFGLFQTLWDGKWVISTFVAIAVLLASSFILFKEPLYESKISYSVDTHPPFYSKEKVLVDFKNKFYSKSVFEDWKKSNVDISFTYEDFEELIVPQPAAPIQNLGATDLPRNNPNFA